MRRKWTWELCEAAGLHNSTWCAIDVQAATGDGGPMMDRVMQCNNDCLLLVYAYTATCVHFKGQECSQAGRQADHANW